MSDPLVVGVDVGSQGTCAQADRRRRATLAASAYERARRAATRGPAGRSRIPREWLGRARRTLARGRRAASSRARIVALSFGSQLDGLVCGRPGRRAAAPRDHLDGPPRRRGVRGLAERVDPERLYASSPAATSTRGHVAREDRVARERRTGACTRAPRVPAARLVRGAGGLRRARRRPVERLVARCCSTRAPATWAHRGAATAFGVDPARLAPVVAPHAVLGAGARRGCARRRGSPPATLVVLRLRRRDGRDARRRRRRPGRRVRRHRHRRARLRRRLASPSSTRPGWSSCIPHADPETLAAGEPGLALRRRVPLVPRPARPPGARRGPARSASTSTSC